MLFKAPEGSVETRRTGLTVSPTLRATPLSVYVPADHISLTSAAHCAVHTCLSPMKAAFLPHMLSPQRAAANG